MNLHRKYSQFPITAFKPKGWLKNFLENQREGITGHLDEVGSPFNTDSWSSSQHEESYNGSWWPYEQNGYWVDGMLRCGFLLEDKFLMDKAMKHIRYVLDNQKEDGYLGPEYLKVPKKVDGRWPHAVFFRALMAYYEATNDEQIINALTKHYLSGTYPHWQHRDVCNIEIMLWLYEKNGDERLLDYALESYRLYNINYIKDDNSLINMLSDKPATEHGVTYNEMGKLGAILSVYTDNEQYLKSSINTFAKIDKYHMLVDGINSSSEHIRGNDPLDSHETCDVTDYTWSVGYLLMATGDVQYADKIEKACFNALPGSITADFKALQYLSCPNQLIADEFSNHNLFYRGNNMLTYRPNPNTACCPGNVNRAMPNYVSRMWMSDGANGIAACLYGPVSVTAQLGETLQEVTIIEETNYPFSENIDFYIKTTSPVKFSLKLRIPTWCEKAQVFVNSELQDMEMSPGSFVTLLREFKNSDHIILVLPMKIRVSHWSHGGVAIERGPLVYSLRIQENWQVDTNEKEKASTNMPAYNIYPSSSWNYALDIDVNKPEDSIQVIFKGMQKNPWVLQNAPMELKVPARKVNGWELERMEKVEREVYMPGANRGIEQHEGSFTFAPQLPDPAILKELLGDEIEYITLVPYGCTRLRLTIFPYAK